MPVLVSLNGDQIAAICGAISGLVTLIPTVITVVMFIINTIKNKNWNQVQSLADAAMRNVEQYCREHPGELTSEQKLEMALESIREGLAAVGIKFDDKLCNRTIAYIKASITWFNEMK